MTEPDLSNGDRLMWGDREQLRPGTLAMRATAYQNTCGAPWAARHWMLVPDTRAPD